MAAERFISGVGLTSIDGNLLYKLFQLIYCCLVFVIVSSFHFVLHGVTGFSLKEESFGHYHSGKSSSPLTGGIFPFC